jgi:hypothetical protein
MPIFSPKRRIFSMSSSFSKVVEAPAAHEDASSDAVLPPMIS